MLNSSTDKRLEPGFSSPPLTVAAMLLSAAFCTLPFLLPQHALPLPSFQAEWLAFALGVASVGLAFLGSVRHASTQAPLPAFSVALLALAAFIAIQGALNSTHYWSIPLLGMLYLVLAATIHWLGAQLAAVLEPTRLVTLVARSILAGALLSALIAFIQVAGKPPWLDGIVAGLSSDRAYGNIAQANLFANYIALGEASLILLWANRSLSTPAAIMAALMLAGAGSLSGTRSVLLFAGWFLVMGAGTLHGKATPACRRFAVAAIGMGLVMLSSSVLAQWLGSLFASAGALSRTLDGMAFQGEPRWLAWRLAWGIFLDHPAIGAGWGSFSGMVFAANMSPVMTGVGEVWTSAHNLVLHLLAETGLFGTAILLSGLALWAWGVARSWRSEPNSTTAWVVAVVGIEVVHSMVEFPLWSAHFLALTVLVMGIGAKGAKSLYQHDRILPARASASVTNSVHSEMASKLIAWAPRLRTGSLAIACLALSMGIAFALRDFVRLESTLVTGTSITLATHEQAKRDAQIMAGLSHGLLATVAEAQVFARRRPEEAANEAILDMSARVMSYWPSHAVTVRRAIVLAKMGQSAAANELIIRLDRAFPSRCRATLAALDRAREVSPEAIDQMLAALRGSETTRCGKA